MPSFELQQKQSQLQVLSQKQIQALGLLSLGSADMREELYKAVAENPALIIKEDKLEEGTNLRLVSRGNSDYTHLSRSTSAAQTEASDNFQAALEAQADRRESLAEHLREQFHLLPLSPTEQTLGERLIANLDGKGFHILAPVSLLDRQDPLQTPELLARCMDAIQQLDPIGTCTTNIEESLLVQARHNPRTPPLALFLLDGHLDFLNPPQEAKVAKKIASYREAQKKLFGAPRQEGYGHLDTSADAIRQAIDFIRTLDPFPARNFGAEETHYIAPDVFVEALPADDDSPQGTNGDGSIVTVGKHAWRVRLATDTLPSLGIAPSFARLEGKNLTEKDRKTVQESVKKAQDVMESLAFRANTIQRACLLIVQKQHEFFAKGPGHLVPLRQQDIADALGVHETTVSRMANNKYLQCEWGLFAIKYFFTTAVSGIDGDVSKDTALHALQDILKEHAADGKKLSDQKISDILAERGLKVARRTVAKYRSQLNIDSSYTR